MLSAVGANNITDAEGNISLTHVSLEQIMSWNHDAILMLSLSSKNWCYLTSPDLDQGDEGRSRSRVPALSYGKFDAHLDVNCAVDVF